ncbi:CoA ester lyase [Candidatus Amarolinea dominans]|uniref:HpcH/HpaI aldolase/citrate lyase family protein n=1 Tax=Candidatus Amarolinea dominans TaxID=3140696 RepID=UPI0031358F67|nr:CoA ester lyase [Anaerolineae bacterium]
MARVRRSLLFMPGDSLRKIEKATRLPTDSIIMDLEDGVAFSRKAEARATIVEALAGLDFGSRERLVRINPVGSGLETADLDAVMTGQPDGLVIPKVESAAQVQMISQALAAAEQAHGWSPGTVRLLVIVETALGVMNVREIAAADGRVDALMFGAEDLAGDMGATRTAEGWEVFYARSAVVTAAAAYRRQAIDTVFVDLNDMDGLQRECQRAMQMGYTGKMAIHPRQVEVINAAFTPSAEAVAQARRLIEAHARQQAAGTGAFAYEGKMVDMPLIRAAEQVIARAGLVGSGS